MAEEHKGNMGLWCEKKLTVWSMTSDQGACLRGLTLPSPTTATILTGEFLAAAAPLSSFSVTDLVVVASTPREAPSRQKNRGTGHRADLGRWRRKGREQPEKTAYLGKNRRFERKLAFQLRASRDMWTVVELQLVTEITTGPYQQRLPSFALHFI